MSETTKKKTGNLRCLRNDHAGICLSVSSIAGLCIYTMSHKKWNQLIFVCNCVKNQRILMQFSLLELTMNDTCDGINFTHLT